MSEEQPDKEPVKRPRQYRRSGFYTVKGALSRGGLSALDGRSAVAQAVKAWRSAVAADLGGDAELSQAKRSLLDVACQDVVLLNIADGWLREAGAGIINKRKRAFVPLVEQRLKVASHLADLLKTLGLERHMRTVPSASEIMAASVAK